MSAIKEYMATIAESKNRTSMLLNAWREISDRLDRLEKLSNERCVHIQEVIDGENCACGSYRPVSVVSQSPMPVEVPPPSTLYTGDTERGCDQPAQEQLWICPKAKDCPCNQHILEKPSCNHVVPHKKLRLCESASSVCPECIPYAQEQGGDADCCNCLYKDNCPFSNQRGTQKAYLCDKSKNWKPDYATLVKERADLRARLEQAEAMVKELTATMLDAGELAIRRGKEIERLEKENAELKNQPIAVRCVDKKCDDCPIAPIEIFNKLRAENAELKRQLKSEVK